jgi:hypothetical protein
MSDELDRDTAERMLRGEDAGPPKVAALLAAASAGPVRDDPHGEEAAVAAFRAARSAAPARVPRSRRMLRPRLIAVRAALAGLLLILAGGVATATSQHLRMPFGDRHAPATRTPATSQTSASHLTAPAAPHVSPSDRTTTGGTPTEKTSQQPKKPHPSKKPKKPKKAKKPKKPHPSKTNHP